ncbi:HemK/PrmC family methyltransferase [Porphyromonas sp.]|uniref:N5-glutamine methyltransferase family protein n=1 Tax=Porphyromonas sp. TaxID=1924944 RepID=UPI0026DD13D1|nr:HemK/PrmC family methyltransferase [Porphyromonas sp.]MDO4695677.1 HemK/PrmC family methyltransferase [Porphyromonas sp.]MDO4771499.1 HemK/PrmC family methyltransferase [Porphyromonas sp.]
MIPIRSFKDDITRQLMPYYPQEEAEAISRRLLEEAFGQPYPMLVITPPKDTQFREGQETILLWIGRLKRKEPLQYILSYTIFDGLSINVRPGVLIPRMETEELCQRIRDHFTSDKREIKAIDICTGSGCIALSLANSFSQAKVEALDWSDEALSVAKDNFSSYPELSHRLTLIRADILSGSYKPDYDFYDIVVSNPPYVMDRERTEILPHVLDYEPSMALFVSDDDPLIFYKSILQYFSRRLAREGLLAFEINQSFGKETVALCEEYGLNAILEQDQYGRDRFVFATPKY